MLNDCDFDNCVGKVVEVQILNTDVLRKYDAVKSSSICRIKNFKLVRITWEFCGHSA
jgi:hypothetical protein